MAFTKNRGSKRLRRRGGRGRFTRSTLRNTFGFAAIVCSQCRGITTVPAGEQQPETCKHCDAALVDAVKEPNA